MALRLSIGSVSLVRQGEHRFYSFTILSDVLASCCYVVNREEDPEEGFQRELDVKRAKEIAAYIDEGLGTIPSSIVLSAQEDCEFEYDSKRKSVSFKKLPKAFLIIDGQHRVFGFKLAATALRIPVVVYEGLSKRDETRLFIDINSKQRGVRPELLLDIKKLAEYENDTEQFLRELFDHFASEDTSALYGKLSAATKSKGKITRAVFNAALKPLVKLFGTKNPNEVYEIYNSYLVAFIESIFIPNDLEDELVNVTMFKALSGFFPLLSARVKDKFGAIYSVDNYHEFLSLISSRIKPAKLRSTKNAYLPIVEHFEDALKTEFSL